MATAKTLRDLPQMPTAPPEGDNVSPSVPDSSKLRRVLKLVEDLARLPLAEDGERQKAVRAILGGRAGGNPKEGE